MRRMIVEPADVSSSALADLKGWLGISRPNEDELLKDLLRSGLSMCEAFIGQVPVSQLIEERVPMRSGAYVLGARPVTSFASAEIVAQSGIRTALALDDFEFAIRSDGTACFALSRDKEGQAVAVRARAGIAADWDSLPGPLKQGIIRLCAHLYHDRDRPASSRQQIAPPASVSALWGPWRLIRLT